MTSRKLRVVIKSRQIPVDTALSYVPVFMSGVRVGSVQRRSLVYRRSVDAEDLRAIEGAQKLASSLGIGLEVVDESKPSLMGRVLARLEGSGRLRPTKVASPPSSASSGLQPTTAQCS